MKKINNSEAFEITYNLKVHDIPAGDMEISDDAFAAFIIAKGQQWGMDIEKIGDSDTADVKVIEEIKQEKSVKEDDEKPAKEETKSKKTKK